ncbi:digestive cysteine proteinase 1-like [Lingula anatina]|uniref:Digestive cysteine proteinase 1-like n=1 Tax=Lingula anatina TaxID=7574 RepID=A0A1S3KEH6_LINAN|nr:digestive cysteine proteinase 1-like [Lingula anatina]|eukprot:XP_013420646.1 digestive cysteine proteinase 1-like [Lingula anatina]
MAWRIAYLVFAGFLGTCLGAAPTKPSIAKAYQVGGMLQLPYAEIKEPFYAYYDGHNNRTRIDYYSGMSKMYQRGDLKKSYSVVFTSYSDDKLNQLTCFESGGMPQLQSVFPDLTNFTLYAKGQPHPTGANITVDAWRFVMTVGKKKNTYTFYVDSKKQIPVRYEMFGYDTLMGSHYDKYYIDYHGYLEYTNTSLNVSVFQPTVKNCSVGYTQTKNSEKRILMNPMREYVHHDDLHIHEMFEDFKKTYQRNFMTIKEHETRKFNFRHNVRFIHSKNRAGLSYKVAVNHLADRSPWEMKKMRGRLYKPGYNGGLPFNKKMYESIKLPSQVDWRNYGAVTPVKDQAVCGSCWSFGTTGTLEGTYFLMTGKLLKLSQQELIDCSWGEGNMGCDGGDDFLAYQWIRKHGGLTTEEIYGSYMAVDGKCHWKTNGTRVQIKVWYNVTSGDSDALKMALAKHGPISVAIDASHKSFSFYSNGVYYEPKCGNAPEQLDHAVLAVGYGTMNGKAYWLVKNSWSTYWGNDGYVLMAQKDNNCGVETDPTFVTM